MLNTLFLLNFQNPGSVPPATKNSKMSPLPPEPAGFYDRGATVDIPLDTAGAKSQVCETKTIFLLLFLFTKIPIVAFPFLISSPCRI